MSRNSEFSNEVRERAGRLVQEHGVESICKVLPIAPSTYRLQATLRRDPARRSERARRDAALVVEVKRVHADSF